ncbi:MAG: GNAT family N-acetyltransferase [Acidobacteria bacterium]|nr:GNAT family N-acetyltransferase [Acidobacteriota bacterium]
MKQIRPFVRDDIPQVADLHQRVFRIHGKPHQRSHSAELSQAYAKYFEEIFLRNPWYDEALPSLVYQKPTGRITGFLGVMPRRMSLNGQLIKVALGSQFIVAPDSRSTGALLLKTFLSGPQDLSLTDEANSVSRKLWEKLGGTAALFYSIHWTRPLRPSRFVVSLISSFFEERKPWSYLVSASRPICNLADAIVVRKLPRYFRQTAPQVSAEDLKIETLLRYLSEFSNTRPLWPEYDDRSLKWLFEAITQKEHNGALRGMSVHNAKREMIGWYLYHLKPGGTSTVLQIVARNNSMSEVLDHLFYDALRQDSVAVSGRLDPRFMREVSDKYCFFNCGRPWVLIHSRNPDLLRVFNNGDAMLSKLEGEWCMRFE